jgi:signal transduction histidine kinase
MDAPAESSENTQPGAPVDSVAEMLRSVLAAGDIEGAHESLAADVRLSCQMRSLAQITPAVAHDLRAPINAMVFNIEVLKETLAAGPSLDPAMRERQLRYVNVLKEELHRLHKSLEIFLAHISPRGDRTEVLDLREVTEELAALLVGPARKQQAQVRSEVPPAPVSLEVNRYLLRQALLHLALEVLGPVPRQGVLEIRLEHRDGTARLRLEGTGTAAEPPAPRQEGDTGMRFSPGGTLAQLQVARELLAAQGATLRPLRPLAEPTPVYEIEWMIPDTDSDKE